MMLLKLRFADEAAWLAARASVPAGSEIVVIGEVRHTTGRMVDAIGPGGTTMSVPETVPVPGYLVDAIMPDVPEALRALLVNPVQPRHVFAGNYVLAMPEVLPEAEETLMVTRGIGAVLADDELARIELQLLRGRITPDMAADRRAWVEAGIAITESRAALAEARQARAKAVEDARKADAERDRINAERAAALAQRDAEEAKRVAAVTAAQTATGKARTDALAARDAAIAARKAAIDAAASLLAVRDAEVAKLAAAVKARDDAGAVLAAERAKIEAARAARAVAKAAIKP